MIFDCDGVLIDSERLAAEVDMELLAELSWALSEDEVIRRFVGQSNAEIRRQIEEHLGHELRGGWDRRFKRRYDQVFADRLAPVDGAIGALDSIHLPTCVASNSGHEYLRQMLSLTGLYERFAGRIFSAEDVPCAKPAPDLFLHASKAMGVEPGRCVVVEDSAPGVKAARAAGMYVFAFAGGLMPAGLLAGPNTTVFEHMGQLAALVERRAQSGPLPTSPK